MTPQEILAFLSKGPQVNRALPNNGGYYNVANSTPNGVSTPITSIPTASVAPSAPNNLMNLAATSPSFPGTPTQGTPAEIAQSKTTSAPSYGGEYYQPSQSTVTPPVQQEQQQTSEKASYNPREDYLNLMLERDRHAANNTGLYAIDPNAGYSPEQISNIRSAADKIYSKELGKLAGMAQQEPNQRFGVDSVLSGLSIQGANRVNALADKFDSAPVVKGFNQIQRAALDADKLGKVIQQRGGKAAAGEDLQLVYMMAKAMDPESVVREGEYATAQKYLATILQGVKYNVSRFTKDTPEQFLTPEARNIVLEAIKRKYNSDKDQYDNLKKETVRKINDVAGSEIGDKLITNYENAYTETPRSSSSNTSFQEEW